MRPKNTCILLSYKGYNPESGDLKPEYMNNGTNGGESLTNGSPPLTDNNYNNALSLMLASKGRDAPDGQPADPDMINMEDMSSPTKGDLSPTETSYTTENGGKINVTVTVTINAGTLADLKKQRAQIRNSSPDISSLPVSPVGSESLQEETPPSICENMTVTSPTGSVHRFTGNTGEVVGDVTSKRCCVIQ